MRRESAVIEGGGMRCEAWQEILTGWIGTVRPSRRPLFAASLYLCFIAAPG
jgi:hypothetical protein